MDTVVQILLQRVHDHSQRLPPVVVNEVLDVLQEKEPWAMMREDARDIEEESTLGLAAEPVRAVQCVLLGDTRERERLAWEPGQKTDHEGEPHPT